MYVITGAAGFIGSALLWKLNQRGTTNLLLVDEIDNEAKERNIGSLTYEELARIDEFRTKLLQGEYDDKGIEAVIHMGAISSTSEKSWPKLQDRNVEYSKDVIRWCVDHGVRCIYASSGAVYGEGEAGYSDEHDIFEKLRPRNLYGKSKLVVDVWARDAGYLEHVVGLRFFNVFGPNEYHKGPMRSVVAKQYAALSKGKPIQLFKSYRRGIRDGEQRRDFVYVKDAVDVVMHFLDQPKLAGVYNVGTGKAHSWNELARAMFAAMKKEPDIQYIEMPDELKEHYQYFTQADVRKLRKAGYTQLFTALEEAVADYVQNFLAEGKHFGESEV